MLSVIWSKGGRISSFPDDGLRTESSSSSSQTQDEEHLVQVEQRDGTAHHVDNCNTTNHGPPSFGTMMIMMAKTDDGSQSSTSSKSGLRIIRTRNKNNSHHQQHAIIIKSGHFAPEETVSIMSQRTERGGSKYQSIKSGAVLTDDENQENDSALDESEKNNAPRHEVRTFGNNCDIMSTISSHNNQHAVRVMESQTENWKRRNDHRQESQNKKMMINNEKRIMVKRRDPKVLKIIWIMMLSVIFSSVETPFMFFLPSHLHQRILVDSLSSSSGPSGSSSPAKSGYRPSGSPPSPVTSSLLSSLPSTSTTPVSFQWDDSSSSSDSSSGESKLWCFMTFWYDLLSLSPHVDTSCDEDDHLLLSVLTFILLSFSGWRQVSLSSHLSSHKTYVIILPKFLLSSSGINISS